ncbi:MAG: hypothetical protein M0T77_02125 [Actinomycetota bacterium]|nr:hypothetical protein [Actinomycetota bacterium]
MPAAVRSRVDAARELVRLPVGLVGLGITIAGVIVLMAAQLGGHFVDRAGPRRALRAGWKAAGTAGSRSPRENGHAPRQV